MSFWTAKRATIVLLVTGGLLAAAKGLASPAAADMQRLQSAVFRLEQQARGLPTQFHEQRPGSAEEGQRRLVDAELLYNLRDYGHAAMLLLDYVEKYPNSTGYPEALFYLGDSLYQRRDYRGARQYFTTLSSLGRSSFRPRALVRLVELALGTGDDSQVETYLAALREIPAGEDQAGARYVEGKYYFFRKDTDRAISVLSAIGPTDNHYRQARYLLGAALVKKHDLNGALRVFLELAKLPAEADWQQRVRDLAYVGAGRLLYEKNKLIQSVDAYRHVPRNSPIFDAALHEVAWTYIKEGRFDSARRALELLLLTHPDSPLAAEVTLLQGNLLIRLERWGKATDVFSKTRDEFMPGHQKVKELLTRSDNPELFVQALTQRPVAGETLAARFEIPKIARQWAKDSPNVKNAMLMVSDVDDIAEGITEAKELVRRLELRINSPLRVRIFPEIGLAESHAVELGNQAAHLRLDILKQSRGLFTPVLGDAERRELGRMSTTPSLEPEIAQLPVSLEAFHEREKAQLRRAAELEDAMAKTEVALRGEETQLDALVKHVGGDTDGKKSEILHSVEVEVAHLRDTYAGIQAQMDDVHRIIEQAREAAGVGGAQEVQERSLKARYREQARQQLAFLGNWQARLQGSAAEEFYQLRQLAERLEHAETQLDAYDEDLRREVEARLARIRTTVEEQKKQLEAYEASLGGYRGQVDSVAGQVGHAGLQAASQRMYDVAVRADVGIIDVGWALKDTKTKEVSRLLKQRKIDLKVLDSEYAEVLKGN